MNEIFHPSLREGVLGGTCFPPLIFSLECLPDLVFSTVDDLLMMMFLGCDRYLAELSGKILVLF